MSQYKAYITSYEDALKLAESKWWINKTSEEIVKVQFFNKLVVGSFPIFHSALEEVLGRSLWFHDLGNISVNKRINDELLKKFNFPTIQELYDICGNELVTFVEVDSFEENE